MKTTKNVQVLACNTNETFYNYFLAQKVISPTCNNNYLDLLFSHSTVFDTTKVFPYSFNDHIIKYEICLDSKSGANSPECTIEVMYMVSEIMISWHLTIIAIQFVIPLKTDSWKNLKLIPRGRVKLVLQCLQFSFLSRLHNKTLITTMKKFQKITKI